MSRMWIGLKDLSWKLRQDICPFLLLIFFLIGCEKISAPEFSPKSGSTDAPLNTVLRVRYQGKACIDERYITTKNFRLSVCASADSSRSASSETPQGSNETTTNATDDPSNPTPPPQPNAEPSQTQISTPLQGSLYSSCSDSSESGMKVTDIYFIPIPSKQSSSPLEEEKQYCFEVGILRDQNEKETLSGSTSFITEKNSPFLFESSEVVADVVFPPRNALLLDREIVSESEWLAAKFSKPVHPLSVRAGSFFCRLDEDMTPLDEASRKQAQSQNEKPIAALGLDEIYTKLESMYDLLNDTLLPALISKANEIENKIPSEASDLQVVQRYLTRVKRLQASLEPFDGAGSSYTGDEAFKRALASFQAAGSSLQIQGSPEAQFLALRHDSQGEEAKDESRDDTSSESQQQSKEDESKSTFLKMHEEALAYFRQLGMAFDRLSVLQGTQSFSGNENREESKSGSGVKTQDKQCEDRGFVTSTRSYLLDSLELQGSFFTLSYQNYAFEGQFDRRKAYFLRLGLDNLFISTEPRNPEIVYLPQDDERVGNLFPEEELLQHALPDAEGIKVRRLIQ